MSLLLPPTTTKTTQRLSRNLIPAVMLTIAMAVAPADINAITITMEHTPEDENPIWDPDGSILTAHFQAAAAIWENVLRGSGNYSFDFHWDDDIDDPDEPGMTLGLTSDILGDIFVEINPNGQWFVDPTPGEDEEFSVTANQTLFGQLTTAHQATYFPGTNAPPATLEVGFTRVGIAGSPGVGGFNAANGFDLLSTIVHELGHVLGIAGTEPGEYNIYPHHVGGIQDVLVLEDNDGGHLAGEGIVPFLMCENCGAPGVRRVPTATDVLVVAEDQGISDVHLARVGRITSGVWSDANAWIGGAMPGLTQDVYFLHGGAVALDADAEANTLALGSADSLVVGGFQLTVNGELKNEGVVVSVGAGGVISADRISGDPNALATSAGSIVRFNQFLRSDSSTATSASFQGSVEIGDSSGAGNFATYHSQPIVTWNIGENLAVGAQKNMRMLLDGSSWTVAGDAAVAGSQLFIQGGGQMSIGGDLHARGSNVDKATSVVSIEATGNLEVEGSVIADRDSRVTYKGATSAYDQSYDVRGGATGVVFEPPLAPTFSYTRSGSLAFENQATAHLASITVEGGIGNGAVPGSVTFKDTARASGATLHAFGGRGGPTSPYLPLHYAGNGGLIQFEDESNAGSADIFNYGTNYSFGTGGLTTFSDRSSANNADIKNHGSSYIHGNGRGGGVEFTQSARATFALITNFGSVSISDAGHTTFRDASSAEDADIFNESGSSYYAPGGHTIFRNESTAGRATIYNRGNNSTFGNAEAGNTRFFDDATAGEAVILLNPGSPGGRAEFFGNSRAGKATLTIQSRTMSAGSGGSVIFHDNSSADHANIVMEPNSFSGIVRFNDHASASDASFVIEPNANTRIQFYEHASAGTSAMDIGKSGYLQFFGHSTAASAEVTVRESGLVTFSGDFNAENDPTSSAGAAAIRLLGADTAGSGVYGGAMTFGSWSTAGDSNITVEGGTIGSSFNKARGASVTFDASGRAGNSTITLNGGQNGGAGGELHFVRGGNGDTARIVANAGSTVFIRNSDAYGDTTLGSLEGAGTVRVNPSGLLYVGGRNSDTTFSGAIVPDSGFSGGRLTKTGAGTLTLSGANAYTGLTKVDGGGLLVNGSIAGAAEVNHGGSLGGVGTIGGAVAVHAGGTLAPGASPGTITLGDLTIMPGGVVEMELADDAHDRIAVVGGLTLGGTLSISLLDGYVPDSGAVIDLFDFSSVGGAFSTIILPALPTALDWDISALANDGVLSVVEAIPNGADFNGDSVVDGSDLVQWQRDFGVNNLSDADSDGDSDGADLLVWQRQLGQRAPEITSTGTVPEPASLVLLALGLPFLGTRIRGVIG